MNDPNFDILYEILKAAKIKFNVVYGTSTKDRNEIQLYSGITLYFTEDNRLFKIEKDRSSEDE